jgi:Fe2+ or Zn2+ uptake regulation protein
MTEQRRHVYDWLKKRGRLTRSQLIHELFERTDGLMDGNRVDRALYWLEKNGYIESDHRRCTCRCCIATYEAKK